MTPEQRADLIDELADAIADRNDVDVSFRDFAEAAFEFLAKRGLIAFPSGDMNERRKIIQIAMDSHPMAAWSLHALCNDGTVWRLENAWVPVAPIPQPKRPDAQPAGAVS